MVFLNGLIYMRLFFYLYLVVVSVVSTSTHASSDYSPDNIIQWKPKSFDGDTTYSLTFDKQLKQSVIRAESNSAASGLFFEERIDLNATPFLSWSWKVEKFPVLKNEQTKSGDDYAARIYVVVKDGWTVLGTKAISYVWSQQSPEETAWPNPFSGKKTMMLSVQQGNVDNGWVMEKRNLKEDLRKLFGKDFQYIDAIAIMTDTDNSLSSAVGFYSALTFSEQ